jgi:hypothetical protein
MSDYIYQHKSPRRWNPVLTFPALVNFKDKFGKIHNPPLPPRVNGLLPWESERGKFPRKRALKNCPNLGCRRAEKCIDKINDRFCRKTHLTRDQLYDALTKRINKINEQVDVQRKAQGLPDPVPDPDDYDDGTPGPKIRQALVERREELHRRALLRWQKKWLKDMKLAEINSPPPPPS